MTGWQACAEKLAGLEEGKLYKFEGLKSLELSYGDSDIELVFFLYSVFYFIHIISDTAWDLARVLRLLSSKRKWHRKDKQF
jgi:hypothetical protein